MAFRTFNGIPHPLIYAALIPVRDDVGLPGFDLLMPQKEFTVGRGEHNDICIRGPHISNDHCKLVWDAERRAMFVHWLPTTNGTWIRNRRYECHRLKKNESFHLLRDISFGPAIYKYGKGAGPSDYLYTFRYYGDRDLQEHLQPEEFAVRRKTRAQFKTACFDKTTATQRCVIQYRSHLNRAPSAPLETRQATPPFVPPPALGDDFKVSGNVGHFEPRDRPDGHDWADPDIVWRGFVPVNPDTKPVFPGDVELWSHHYGLPVGLHPEYSTHSGVPYDDTFTEIDRRRQEQAERYLTRLRSAEHEAIIKALCERTGQTYFPRTRTPSPSPTPESSPGHVPQTGEPLPAMTTSTPPSPSKTVPPLLHSLSPVQSGPASPEPTSQPTESLSSQHTPSSLALYAKGSIPTVDSSPPVKPHKRKRGEGTTGDELPPMKRRYPRSLRSGSLSTPVYNSEDAEPVDAAHTPAPRRSTRLADKPATQYKY